MRIRCEGISLAESTSKSTKSTSVTIPESFDYEKIGLMVGLEIHQQLDSAEKLHCHCPNHTMKEEDITFEFMRYLRPKANNLGMLDAAVVEQTKSGRKYIYKGYENVCLGDIDEESPATMNPEALDIGLTIAKYFRMVTVDNIQVMRKIIVDGSGVTGYQRTSYIAGHGLVETPEGNCRIASLCVEEDSAPSLGTTEDYLMFSLDRLGIPLAEIATEPDIRTPQQARAVAARIGMTLRSTGRVKRGLGTIRQDVNISITGGRRIELKGVQALDMMEELIKREIVRQQTLIAIRDELNARGASVPGEIVDVTSLFENTSSKVLQKGLKSENGKIVAILLKGFDGFVGREVMPGRRLGTEFSDKGKALGVTGLFHTDELPAYGITPEEVEKLRSFMKAAPEDAVIMMAGREDMIRRAMEAVVERAQQTLVGIPAEVRHALPDGNSSYMRPMPGAARMHPETDVEPIPLDREYYKNIRLPELLTEKAVRMGKDYALNDEFAEKIAFSSHADLFEKLAAKYKGNESVTPTLMARVFTGILPEMKRDGEDIDVLKDDHFEKTFDAVASGKASKDAVRDILSSFCRTPDRSTEEIIGDLGIGNVDVSEIESFVDDLVAQKTDFIRSKGMAATGPLMGPVMAQFRGKADGKLINKIVTEKIRAVLES